MRFLKHSTKSVRILLWAASEYSPKTGRTLFEHCTISLGSFGNRSEQCSIGYRRFLNMVRTVFVRLVTHVGNAVQTLFEHCSISYTCSEYDTNTVRTPFNQFRQFQKSVRTMFDRLQAVFEHGPNSVQ